MSIYFAGSTALTETPVLAVEPAPVDRTILITEASGEVFVGFGEVETVYGLLGASSSQIHQFVIPADHGLWGRSGGTSAGFRFLVTSIGR
jgi:hypothetical protein